MGSLLGIVARNQDAEDVRLDVGNSVRELVGMLIGVLNGELLEYIFGKGVCVVDGMVVRMDTKVRGELGD